VEVTVEVAGKRFEAQPKRIRQAFSKYPNEATRSSTSRIKIGEQEFDVDVHQWETTDDNARVTHTVYLSPGCPPHVLKRHSKRSTIDPPKTQGETWVSVTRLGVVAAVLGETRPVWHVKTVHERDDERSTVQEVHCPDVPGLVVSHKAESRGKSGGVTQSSRLELVDYRVPGSSSSSAARRGWFRHFRRVGSN
jgi:hypothetical protein